MKNKGVQQSHPLPRNSEAIDVKSCAQAFGGVRLLSLFRTP